MKNVDQLYKELKDLVDSNESFYVTEQVLDDRVYHIFNYRLASYTDFLQPSALESRGIMFEMNRDQPIRIAARPMEKFFNLNENPLTQNLDMSTAVQVESKADGSLISSFIHLVNGQFELRMKSKGSLFSDHAAEAMAFLNKPENAQFKQELFELTSKNVTVNMELCSPDFRIVLPYYETELKVLNIRDHSGKYYSKDIIREAGHLIFNSSVDEILDRWVDSHQVDNVVEFVEHIPDMTDIEGFVVLLESGQRVKIKTKWYMALHHSKDSINSDRRLYEAVLTEGSDDLKSMFFTDALAISKIIKMEEFVAKTYNHLVNVVDTFYENNHTLDRKEYAILGQKELNKHEFGLAMSKYLGKKVDYKDFMLSKWKLFGIKDDCVEVE